MPTWKGDHSLAYPTPVHAQTDGAREAVERMIAQGHARRIARETVSIVRVHGRPPVEPYDADPVTPAARRLLASADAAGWKTNLIELADRCAVEGVRGACAFRAVWVRGSIAATGGGAWWHERDYRYEYVDDPRPEPKLNAKLRVSLANRRPVGVSKVHLRVVASPMGVRIGITELTKRIKENAP